MMYGRKNINGIATGITAIVIVLLSSSAGAAPAEQWNRTFGGTGTDYADSVQQTSDGGYILAGYTQSYGAGGWDAWLIRTNANGIEQWNRTFGGKSIDYAYSVQQTSDGGYILAGYTYYLYGYSYEDAWLIKTDANGIEQWNRTFGGTVSSDYAYSVQQTSDGGYILAGITYSYGTISGDAWLIKTNANGIQQWNRTFGGMYSDIARSVQQTSDGGYILAGSTSSYGAGYNDAWLIKTDANGIEQWNRTFGGTGWDYAYSVKQTTDGGYILAGDTSPSANSNDGWLIKTNANGIEQWNRTFRGINIDHARSVQQTSDGGYVLAGDTSSYGAGLADAWLIKTNANGIEQWNKTFGGTNYDYAYSIQQTSDGGYILSGRTGSYGGSWDAWLIKVQAEGPSISPSTDKPTYAPGETIKLKINVSNPTSNTYSATGILNITWPTGMGMNIASQPFIMTPGMNIGQVLLYQIPNSIFVPNGAYRFDATLKYDGQSTNGAALFTIARP